MEITRHNYEEYFVLYLDKELNEADRAAVEHFVQQNPDLKAELEMLQDAILPADDSVVFMDKSLLYRHTEQSDNNPVTALNCEEYFVLYGDNELNNEENAFVENFVYKNPQHQENFELIQQIKFQPEKHIVFPDKTTLYRTSSDDKVVPMFPVMRFWKMAAAAVVLVMIAGSAWYALNNGKNNDNTSGQVASNQKPAVVPPAASEQRSGITENTTNSNLKSESPSVTPATVLKEVNESLPGVEKSANGKKRSTMEPAIINDKTYAANTLKKDSRVSNISPEPFVKQSINEAAKVVEKKIPVTQELPITEETFAVTTEDKQTAPDQVAIGPVALKEGSFFASLSNDNDEVFEASEKKNKMRGFFRKVTRVFDKATSKEPSENRKGLRIASFEIAL